MYNKYIYSILQIKHLEEVILVMMTRIKTELGKSIDPLTFSQVVSVTS